MISYTKRSVLITTLTITVIIYVFISVIWSNLFKISDTTNQVEERKIQQSSQESTDDNTEENVETKEINFETWKIQIPKINLIANIKEGTTQSVMARNVGHFNETSTFNGNVGLAAHNRGIGVESYFKNIKYLEIGDEIIYQKGEEIRKYKVVTNIVIDETDWTYLKNTQDNRLTLITCVENQPEYRRCVQAVQV